MTQVQSNSSQATPETEGHVYECDECDWTGEIGDMDPIDDIGERVLPGEFMAAGQCPECGCLIGVADEDISDYTLESAAKVMRDRGWAVAPPPKD